MSGLAPSNDNKVIVVVDLMNIGNDIARFLQEERAGDMPARRKLASIMREVAEELEKLS